MRKLLFLCCTLIATTTSFSQNITPKKPIDLTTTSRDHFMIQLAWNSWQGAPDSIRDHISGFQRSANFYLMLDKPFKGNSHYSVALGVGIGTSNIYFKRMTVDIASTKPVLPFIATDTVQDYKKYKVATAFLEAPLEFRYSSKPEIPNKSIKAALGIKVGTLINSHTKAKGLETPGGAQINNNTEKIHSRPFFTTTRVAATARFGYGPFGFFGAYDLTSIFKSGVAADMKLFQLGISISGL